MNEQITCVNCGWRWEESKTTPSEQYICHKCGFDNEPYYKGALGGLFDVQSVRLLDVFVVAPFLIYTSTLKGNPSWVRLSLLVLGIATFIYNGKNYLENNKNK